MIVVYNGTFSTDNLQTRLQLVEHGLWLPQPSLIPRRQFFCIALCGLVEFSTSSQGTCKKFGLGMTVWLHHCMLVMSLFNFHCLTFCFRGMEEELSLTARWWWVIIYPHAPNQKLHTFIRMTKVDCYPLLYWSWAIPIDEKQRLSTDAIVHISLSILLFQEGVVRVATDSNVEVIVCCNISLYTRP